MATTDHRKSDAFKKRLPRFFQYLVLFIITLLIVVPLVIMVFGALKTRGQMFLHPYTPPIPPHWENFATILTTPSFWTMLRNSFFIMLASTSGVLIVCSLAAFVFARMEFRGKDLAFNFLTLGLMFPITVAIMPVFLVIRQMHLVDSLLAVILVQTAFGISGNTLILRGFFLSIPVELQDAAAIDGCTTFDFFWRILLPLARPALAAVGALTMIVSWNDFLTPLVLLNSDKLWTLPLGTMQFQGQYSSDLALTAAFVTLSALPAVIFYLFAERQIVAGLTAGALKGLKVMVFVDRLPAMVLLIPFLLSACAAPVSPTASTLTQLPTFVPELIRSLGTVTYRDLFQEYLGKPEAEVQSRLETTWQQLFYGSDDNQRVYYPASADMAYIEDIGNGDVRTEGMSYGMMIAVQLDKKTEFDSLWKWAKTYMFQTSGPFQGYFAWHCSTDGKQLDANPASDGEEWFVTALFFASGRWGNGEGIFDYKAQANQILDTMLHKTAANGIATNMFDPQARQVVFVPAGRNATFTDPSYHLPAFYELWARWADKDNQFWAEAAGISRLFFRKAANPKTGLMADYAAFDGTSVTPGGHKDFRFDAWRTLSNVAVDYAWFGKDAWQVEQSGRVLNFLASLGLDSYPNQYSLSGKALSSDHSTGLVSMAAVAALATSPQIGKPFVQALWDAKIPSGQWRYYDGMLYMLGLLHVSGTFRIYTPQ